MEVVTTMWVAMFAKLELMDVSSTFPGVWSPSLPFILTFPHLPYPSLAAHNNNESKNESESTLYIYIICKAWSGKRTSEPQPSKSLPSNLQISLSELAGPLDKECLESRNHFDGFFFAVWATLCLQLGSERSAGGSCLDWETCPSTFSRSRQVSFLPRMNSKRFSAHCFVRSTARVLVQQNLGKA